LEVVVADPVVMQACAAADFDASTGVCSHPIWVPQPSLFPELDMASAITIGMSILVLWATAFGFRQLRWTAD
jgi:hypothetical protein